MRRKSSLSREVREIASVNFEDHKRYSKIKQPFEAVAISAAAGGAGRGTLEQTQPDAAAQIDGSAKNRVYPYDEMPDELYEV